MRVLVITRKWPPAVGGMEVYCHELVKELRCHVDVDLLALPGRSDGRPPSFRALMGFGLRTAFAVLFNRGEHDVVHGGDLAVWPLVWLATLRQPRARTALTAHGTDIALAHRKGLLATLYAGYLCAGRYLIRKTAILANSGATAALCRASGFSCVKVIPLAAHLPAIVQRPPEPFVLFAGRLIPRKGCGWFIRNVLPRLDPDLRLVVAGTILEEDEQRALAHQRVEIKGPVVGEDLVRLRQTATAVVMPNIDIGINGFEGFGLSAVEAAAAGGVVLASRLHGISDAVKDGVTGFLLPAGQAEAWAAKIEEVQRWTPKRRQSFIERSRKVIARDYSWSRVAEQTLDCYRRLGQVSE